MYCIIKSSGSSSSDILLKQGDVQQAYKGEKIYVLKKISYSFGYQHIIVKIRKSIHDLWRVSDMMCNVTHCRMCGPSQQPQIMLELKKDLVLSLKCLGFQLIQCSTQMSQIAEQDTFSIYVCLSQKNGLTIKAIFIDLKFSLRDFCSCLGNLEH